VAVGKISEKCFLIGIASSINEVDTTFLSAYTFLLSSLTKIGKLQWGMLREAVVPTMT